MGPIVRKIIKEGIKAGDRVRKIDPSSPVTMDGTQFLISAGKAVLKVGKEILF